MPRKLKLSNYTESTTKLEVSRKLQDSVGRHTILNNYLPSLPLFSPIPLLPNSPHFLPLASHSSPAVSNEEYQQSRLNSKVLQYQVSCTRYSNCDANVMSVTCSVRNWEISMFSVFFFII